MTIVNASNSDPIPMPSEGLNLIENFNLTVNDLVEFLTDSSDLPETTSNTFVSVINPENPDPTSFQSLVSNDLPVVATESITENNESEVTFQTFGEVVTEGVTTQATYSGTSLINLNAFRADSRFQNIDGRGLSVVILDTGIDLNHSFFGPDSDNNGIADRIVYQYDFADNDADASDTSRFYGHGSHVSSVIASQSSQFPGVAPKVNIIHLKVFDSNGIGYDSYLEKALQWVINNTQTYNIVGVNMSLGSSGNYSTSQQGFLIANEIATLANNQVTVVSSAGNGFYKFNSVQGVSYPAADPNSLAVGSVYASDYGDDSTDFGNGNTPIAYTTGAERITPYSQRHTSLTDVFAPGSLIGGANWNGGVVYMSGTSMATPHVTGAVVLAQQLALQMLGRRLSVTEITNLLKTTGATINDGDDEDDNVTNTGANFKRLDMYALGAAIANMANPTPTTPTVSISPASITQNEGNSGTIAYTFTVSLNQATSQVVTVNYTTNDGTATVSGNDYTDNDGTLTFNPGSSLTQSVTVYAKGDTLVENNETFNVKLTGATNANISTQSSQATGTIVNDDIIPVVSLTNLQVSQNEGNSGTVAYTFTISLDRSPSQMVTISFGTEDGTATIAGNDYTSSSGMLMLMPGSSLTYGITVNVKGDALVENDETFSFKLTEATGATINPQNSQATGIIINDDIAVPVTPTVSLSPTSISQNEGNSGTVAYTFAVSLSEATSQPVTVNYTTNDGTAKVSGGDYTDNDGTLTFNPGSSLTQNITVYATGDILPEANETFTVNLTGATNANLHAQNFKSTGTIVNDDVYPVISVTSTNSSQNEGNSGTTNYELLISLNQTCSYPVTVRYFTDDGTATLTDADYINNDGTLTFNPGELTKSVTVQVNGDTKVENNETLLFRLARPANAVLSNTQNRVTLAIVNDDLTAASEQAYNEVSAIVSSMSNSYPLTNLLPSSDDLVPFSELTYDAFAG